MLNNNKTEEPMAYQLHPDEADSILQSVFEKTNSAPNTIPLEVLISYSNYRKDRYALQKTVLAVVLVLFLLLPLLFIAPKLSLENTGTEEFTATPVYLIHVDTLIPIRRINVSIDGRSVPIYESDFGEYSVEPTANGTMRVTVTLINNQQSEAAIEVKNVDMSVPQLVKNTSSNGMVYLYLSDEGSGLDYGSIRGYDHTGAEVAPAIVNEEKGFVAFDYPEDSMNVFIADRAGNSLQLVMSVRK